MNNQKEALTDDSIKILVSCHKKFATVANSCICPIAVGVAQKGAIAGLDLCDNQGENISTLNDKFCELTAMYYAYKNIKASYYGFFHYRRYLSLRHIDSKAQSITVKGMSGQFDVGFGLDEPTIKITLNGVDIVVPKPVKCTTVYRHFELAHSKHKQDLEFCIQYIGKNYPHLVSATKEYLSSQQAYYYNMFIAKDYIFFDYCKFLFDVLFAFDKQKDYTDCNTQQKRMAGFLAERLFGIYFTHLMQTNKGLKVLYAPIVKIKNPNDSSQYKIKSKYNQPISSKVTDIILPRGSTMRELCKRAYIKVRGKP